MASQAELTKPLLQLASTGPRWRAYAQLVRLPNVFTAMADIALAWLGAVALRTPASRWPSFLLLMCASVCLYAGGMIWNDFFDIEQDRRERPFRPIPSGRITRRSAALAGGIALALGVFLAWQAGSLAGTGGPLAISASLVLAITLYDGLLKRTWAGPVAMGACRFLNVLLGLSVAGNNFPMGARIFLALVVGLYIVGVTWFARTEARESERSSLMSAAGVMLASLILALAVPVTLENSNPSILFPYLLVALGFGIGIPVCRAIARPAPSHVQRAVKRSIMGLVVLDAVLATALAGAIGLIILVLLLPALYLGRWIYST
ncbi:MAG TPA: UbiA family prenyltransferase [Gemmataceae bacterium]|jgi:4-hydroxybenzoate polyprenyltransferase|nr:UbiA family prenyltransferase [Gemmataceae bacterium]